MHIGILQTGQSPEILRAESGDYPDMFTRLLRDQGLEFTTYLVEEMIFPENIHACDGWLITGSRHGAYEDHPFIPPLEDFIRAAYAAKVPMVGICFGHQIIAQALGGKVEKYAGGWSVGPTEYAFDDQTYTLNAWHQDQVIRVPEGGEVVGKTDTCENAVIRYGDWGLSYQPHPEFSPRFFEGLAEARKAAIPEPLFERVKKVDVPIATDKIAEEIGEFLGRDR